MKVTRIVQFLIALALVVATKAQTPPPVIKSTPLPGGAVRIEWPDENYEWELRFTFSQLLTGWQRFPDNLIVPNLGKQSSEFVFQNGPVFLRLETRDPAQQAIDIAEQAYFEALRLADPQIQQTATGLHYKVIRVGNGASPAFSSAVRVRYTGTLTNGFEFDTSGGDPATFSVSGVISGFREGLLLMQVGGEIRLYIPWRQAYGRNAIGTDIPAFSTLIFDVELIEILN